LALVTGATRGIGAAVTRCLLEGGAQVVGVYRTDDTAAEEFTSSLGDLAKAFESRKLDLAEAGAVGELSDFGAELVVNCAGRSRDALLLRSKGDFVSGILANNLESSITVCRVLLPAMLKARFGRIVNVSSVVASTGNAGQTAYAAAKAGIEGFTRALAREVGGKGITVNCVAPGFIETAMTSATSEKRLQSVLDSTAVGRAGTPAEVAHAISFLCETGASYVTGAVLHVNGGLYM
jgi:3-oxoacyl-[acyl-carrier protein] reductase